MRIRVSIRNSRNDYLKPFDCPSKASELEKFLEQLKGVLEHRKLSRLEGAEASMEGLNGGCAFDEHSA
jgi:hypothetical protein